jgi:hypothetical protein
MDISGAFSATWLLSMFDLFLSSDPSFVSLKKHSPKFMNEMKILNMN